MIIRNITKNTLICVAGNSVMPDDGCKIVATDYTSSIAALVQRGMLVAIAENPEDQWKIDHNGDNTPYVAPKKEKAKEAKEELAEEVEAVEVKPMTDEAPEEPEAVVAESVEEKPKRNRSTK